MPDERCDADVILDVVFDRGLLFLVVANRWKSVRDGQIQRRNVTITLLDEQRQPVLRWLLRNAWPVKIEGPSLHASANEVAIETLELAHEGLELE